MRLGAAWALKVAGYDNLAATIGAAKDAARSADAADEQRDFVQALAQLAVAQATTDRAQRSAAASPPGRRSRGVRRAGPPEPVGGLPAGERIGVPAAVIDQAIASARGIDLA